MIFKLLKTRMADDNIKGLEEFIGQLSPKEEVLRWHRLSDVKERRALL